MIQTLTKENWMASVIQSDQVILVKFGATWCGPCKQLDLILERIAETTPNVSFLKVDINDSEEIAAAQNVRSVPTMIVFKGGEEIDRQIGLCPQSVIETMIDV